jgi:DNA-binding NtrC family response regulator
MDYPTILVVHYDAGFRDVLIRELQAKGYLVLTAQNAAAASEIVIRHSRHIHLLLTDNRDDSRVMATTLKPYRHDMLVIHFDPRLHVDSILMEVSRVLDPPPSALEDQGRIKPKQEEKRKK